MMFRFIIARPANIPKVIPREDMRLYDDTLKIAAQENYQPLLSSNFVTSW